MTRFICVEMHVPQIKKEYSIRYKEYKSPSYLDAQLKDLPSDNQHLMQLCFQDLQAVSMSTIRK